LKVAFEAEPHRWGDEETCDWHRRVFGLLNTAVAWIEARWPGASRVE
jgi:hypothetical protein